jgi:hypothetical protein
MLKRFIRHIFGGGNGGGKGDDNEQDQRGQTSTGDYDLGDEVGERVGKDTHSEEQAL